MFGIIAEVVFDRMFGFSVTAGRHSVYRMSASSPEEKGEWITCIK